MFAWLTCLYTATAIENNSLFLQAVRWCQTEDPKDMIPAIKVNMLDVPHVNVHPYFDLQVADNEFPASHAITAKIMRAPENPALPKL